MLNVMQISYYLKQSLCCGASACVNMWQRSCPTWLILSINIVFIHGRFSFACSTAVWLQEREFQIWLTATKAIYVISDWEKAERLQSRCLKYWNFLLCVWMSVFVSRGFLLAPSPHTEQLALDVIFNTCVRAWECMYLPSGVQEQQHQSLRSDICNICGSCHWSYGHLP